MRILPILLVAFVVGCENEADKAKEDEDFCLSLGDPDDECWSDELHEQCLELREQCEGSISVQHSCPGQLVCG